MSKGVVLLSGGIDSTTLLTYAVIEHGFENVVGLTLFYGQRHSKEIQSAKAVAGYYGVTHIEKDLSSVFDFSDSALLGNSSNAVPDGSYADDVTRDADGMSKTYIPYRNGLFLSTAAAVAYSLGANVIYYGAHADDAAGNAYPDCSIDFYNAQAQAIAEGTGRKLIMEAPLISMTKDEVVKWGLDMDTPYWLTWSCYNGKDRACGTCGTCVDRRLAFLRNDTKDPISYASGFPNTEGVRKQLVEIGLDPEDWIGWQTHSND
ncbi:7-cyano-7-deazaguanine synthase [compost metagenome]